jgi:hypothetical protein
MVPRRDRPLQTWKTFLRNHMEGIASIDLFVVPTIAFQQLFAFLVLSHERRQLWFSVTGNPTAEWLARRITEAFPWDSAPKYLIRDNDRASDHPAKGAKQEAPFDRIRCMRATTRLTPGAKMALRCIACEVCRGSYRDAIPPAPGAPAGAP